ncbi:MAG: RNA methyltransferase, partial [Prevotellaceae bacterium]|nr:RNA methyltransferase [Prevotellaceae bacterium]
GISHLFCSHGTADLYNPKAIQATMGSLARVQVHYVDLPELIRKAQVDVPGSLGAPVYGTFLDGENLYTHPLSAVGLLVMGNEGKGISGSVEQLIHHRLFIPSYPVGHETGESLNVAVATAVVCAEFRRRTCG